jgi:UDP-N-acetylmuramoyl-tripeptide--D-alanyl-D-alanine ligase
MVIEELYSVYLKHPQICTDTRKLIPNSIFIALSGPSFNGNKFAEKALDLGCAYAVIDDVSYKKDSRYIIVEDSLVALQKLSQHHRRKLNCIVIGITGSNGKTTSKELIRNVLSKKLRTQATHGNLNNHIGVPLTILQLQSDTEVAIIEMGASKQGDIKELVEIAEPELGLITNIGMAHLEGMGGIEGVIKTKTELYDFLRINNGSVFVNRMHEVFKIKSAGINQISFGEDSLCDVVGRFISSSPNVVFQWNPKNKQSRSWDEAPSVYTSLIGKYNFENLLAAACIGDYFEIEEDLINQALQEYEPDNNRSQVIFSGSNKLIMDAYNANPTSMEAALLNFAQQVENNKIVVLGKMMELGEASIESHIAIGNLALSLGFDKVYFVGDGYKNAGITGGEAHFETTEKAIDWFRIHPVQHASILIKGSRTNQLERLKELF